MFGWFKKRNQEWAMDVLRVYSNMQGQFPACSYYFSNVVYEGYKMYNQIGRVKSLSIPIPNMNKADAGMSHLGIRMVRGFIQAEKTNEQLATLFVLEQISERGKLPYRTLQQSDFRRPNSPRQISALKKGATCIADIWQQTIDEFAQKPEMKINPDEALLSDLLVTWDIAAEFDNMHDNIALLDSAIPS